MRTLEVVLGDRSYPVYVGSGLLSRAGELLANIVGRRTIVITRSVRPRAIRLDVWRPIDASLNVVAIWDAIRYGSKRISDALLDLRFTPGVQAYAFTFG